MDESELMKRSRQDGVTKVCLHCGKEYRSFKKNGMFCSAKCRELEYCKRERESVTNPYREPTETTLVVIPLWHSEGMSAIEIAAMTNRDIGIVTKILNGEWVLKSEREDDRTGPDGHDHR